MGAPKGILIWEASGGSLWILFSRCDPDRLSICCRSLGFEINVRESSTGGGGLSSASVSLIAFWIERLPDVLNCANPVRQMHILIFNTKSFGAEQH